MGNDIHTIRTLAQLRAACHPQRLLVLETVAREAMSVTEIAARVGETAHRLYYHVVELERAKLIRPARRRKKGNLVEKLYQAIAPSIRVDERLFAKGGGEGVDAYYETIRSVLDACAEDARRLTARGPLPQAVLQRTLRAYNVLRLSPLDLDRLHDRLRSLVEEFKALDRPGASARAALTVVFYPLGDAALAKTRKKQRRTTS